MEALRDEMEEVTLADFRETKNTKSQEEVTPISIHLNFLNRHVMFKTELRDALVEFFKKNYDVFAWSQGEHISMPFPLLRLGTYSALTKTLSWTMSGYISRRGQRRPYSRDSPAMSRDGR